MQSLFEQYRPRTWDDVIGHQNLKVAIQRMKERGSLGGRAFWISGLSGTGKTTCAYLIAQEVCDPENFIEIDCGDVTPAKLDDLEKSLRYRCLGDKHGRAVLLNESHGLRKDTVRKLLVVLERIPNHVCWLFTTTSDGQQSLFEGIDAHPLLSRCIEFRLEHNRYVAMFAQRVQEIAEAEGLGGANPGEYVELAKRCKCNMRQMLCQVEAGQMLREVLV